MDREGQRAWTTRGASHPTSNAGVPGRFDAQYVSEADETAARFFRRDATASDGGSSVTRPAEGPEKPIRINAL